MKKVKIVEVGPRDGLQNEKLILSVEDKYRYIELLLAANLDTIEVGSFVREDKIPQMASASRLASEVEKKLKKNNLHFIYLVPNLQGLKKALEIGVKDIAFFTATSDEFNRKNIGMDISQSLSKIEECLSYLEETKNTDVSLRAYVSTVFGCPYEGAPDYKNIEKVFRFFSQKNIEELSLGDTIGSAHPRLIKEVLKVSSSFTPIEKTAMHFHDTRGLALVNVYTSLEEGIRIFDSASGGLGGCPYAPGSSGNLASEDLCYLLQSEGFETGVDLDKLRKASQYILKKVGKLSPSKYFLYLARGNT